MVARDVDNKDTRKEIVRTEQARQKALGRMLTRSLSLWEKVSSFEEGGRFILMVWPLDHGIGCAVVSGSTRLHTGIGLAWMQGVWWKLCR